MSKGKAIADLGPTLKPFDGNDDFTNWRRMMKNVLMQQDLDDALIVGKPTTMTAEAWTKVLKKIKSSFEIRLTRSVGPTSQKRCSSRSMGHVGERLYGQSRIQ